MQQYNKTIQIIIYFDDVTKGNIKGISNWPQISYNPDRISIIGGSGSEKTNSLFNLITYLRDIDQIYLYTKDLNEAKHQFLIKKREHVGRKDFNDS